MVRRFLLWALERWTGDRYVRVTLLRESVIEDRRGLARILGGYTAVLACVDAAIEWADDHER